MDATLRLVVANETEIDATEQAFVTALLSRSPELVQTVALARAFRTMVREQRAEELDEWLLATDGMAMAGFAGGLKRDLAAVRAALSLPWSTEPVEGQISRLKTVKRTMNGCDGFDLLRHRVLEAARTVPFRLVLCTGNTDGPIQFRHLYMPFNSAGLSWL